MKFLYTILALLIYVQSFALFALKDYGCCGSHTQTEVTTQKKFTCCSHSKHSCETKITKEKDEDAHKTCSGDMCKCVNCHTSLNYLPFPHFTFVQKNIPVSEKADPNGLSNHRGLDIVRTLLQPPRLF